MAEGPDGVAVDVGDGADGAGLDVAARQADGDRAAGLQRLDREGGGARRGGRGVERAAELLAGLLERGGDGARDAGEAQRRRQRAHLALERGRHRLGARGRVDLLAEHRLDRRHEHELVAVVAGALGDRADRLGDAVGGVDALDRRAREALGDARGVDGGTADGHEDLGVGTGEHVDDVDVEGRDLGRRGSRCSRCSACRSGRWASGMIGSPAWAAVGISKDRSAARPTARRVLSTGRPNSREACAPGAQ